MESVVAIGRSVHIGHRFVFGRAGIHLHGSIYSSENLRTSLLILPSLTDFSHHIHLRHLGIISANLGSLIAHIFGILVGLSLGLCGLGFVVLVVLGCRCRDSVKTYRCQQVILVGFGSGCRRRSSTRRWYWRSIAPSWCPS